jgi:hypothetical protein
MNTVTQRFVDSRDDNRCLLHDVSSVSDPSDIILALPIRAIPVDVSRDDHGNLCCDVVGGVFCRESEKECIRMDGC